MKHLLFFLALLTLLGFSAPRFALAANASGLSIVEQIGCDITDVAADGSITVKNPCQINDFVNLFIYLSKWGMSILSILAVLMVVYGGFQFLTAGGRPSKVDEGKRVILGTIIGVIISLMAYIIINTTFAAIAGTTVASNNPFGVIASVFDTAASRGSTIQGQTIKTINRPFSGNTSSGNKKTSTSDLKACRRPGSGWDFSCTAGNLQVYCADPATGDTPIVNIQTKLEAKGFFCDGHDGCYEPNTVQCVRQFQIANCLPPTGAVDARTQDLIDHDTTACILPVAPLSVTDAAAIASKLPETQLSTTAGDRQGCCVVRSGIKDLYCVDGVSTRACGALGADSQFINAKCGTAADTSLRCGFCSDTTNPVISTDKTCYSYASPYWCSINSTNGLSQSFNFGACDGRCASCTHSLRTSF